MSETQLTKNADAMHLRLRNASFLQRKLPYIAVLTLAVSGVAYTNISHQPLVGYWEFLALATGVLCVVTEWENAAGQASSLSADVDASAPLGRYFGHDEHRAVVRRSENAARAGNQPGAFDVARARHFSCRSQSSVLANLLSGPRDGSRRAGDRVVQAVCALFGFGRDILDRTWHGILATPDRQARRKSKRIPVRLTPV